MIYVVMYVEYMRIVKLRGVTGSVTGNVFFVRVDPFTSPSSMISFLQLKFGTMFIIFTILLSTETGTGHRTHWFLVFNAVYLAFYLFFDIYLFIAAFEDIAGWAPTELQECEELASFFIHAYVMAFLGRMYFLVFYFLNQVRS